MSGVEYREMERGYLEQRGLKRFARVLHLWALGVGAVISGDFFGWNFGLAEGGFGGMLIALAVMTVLYIGLCLSIAEMSPALPHAGGAYSFARTALGPWGGYLTGLAENMEYILTPSVIVVGVGGYLGSVFGTPPAWAPMWWVVCYAVFAAINIWGVELSFQMSVSITIAALVILVGFYIAAAPHLDIQRWALAGGPWLPHGWNGVFRSLPFALWVYLGIEQLPLAAEEAHDPAKDMPKAVILGLLTLVLFSSATVVLNTGIAPGVAVLGKSEEPLLDGMRGLFGNGLGLRVLGLLACTGLLASFHTIIFAYGRQIYSLSRAGYFPTWLSVTDGRRKTPLRALLTGSALSLSAAAVIYWTGQRSSVGAVLLNMAVFGAVVAYLLQMISFIALRRRYPEMFRPYRSPLGNAGAVVAAVLSFITLMALFAHPDSRPGVTGAAIWFLFGALYFALFSRKRLVLAPEEEFALRRDPVPL